MHDVEHLGRKICHLPCSIVGLGIFFPSYEGLTDYIVEEIYSVLIAAVIDLHVIAEKKCIASCLSI